ncbi:peptidase domain-containing ABC transporter [Rheinheimera sp. MMS21-TC3]|uniref:peptidase domain-containing ABC transporter n=1 Tax=Rheinheimera sp. MMS21-TC3 TaxID=3072790 RepID=UPI0028C4D240|nr:peptidase domain-containing ABC transporter [Rheinheimera sp. MMS21-TC3]WNO59753.1 peptidase domain-containing ABC transporter [Rheinheimera sp. MMS21-TC3]
MQAITEKLSFWQGDSLPIINQTEAAECGLACLAMIAHYHGHKASLNELRQKFSISIEGCTLLDLMNFSEKLNLSSRPLRIELEDLPALQLPCILHWDLNHFVVLKSVHAKYIVIHDPASGVRKVSIDEASKSFTGIALELLPTNDFELKQGQSRLGLSHFWSKITGLKRSLVLLFTLSILLQVFTLISPYYMQLVVDDVIMTSDTSLLIVLALGFALVLLFEVMTSALREFVLLHFGNSMNIQMASNLFHHLIRLPLTYFEKRHMGDVVSRFGSLRQVRELLTTGMIEALIDGLMAIAILIVIVIYSPLLSMVVLVSVALYALFRMAMYNSLRAVSEQEILAGAKENSNFMETVRAIQTIKLFGSEAKREGIWQNHYVEATNQSIRLGIFDISYQTVNRLLFGIENIVVVYLAATLVLEGGFSTGMLFAFIAYKSQFMSQMARLIEKLIEFKMLSLHFERLGDIALTGKERVHPVQERKPVEVQGKLELRNISFAYSDVTNPVLQDLSLIIKPGESVALVGPSGCGKTTLMKIMLGLLLPCSGKVLVDDIPLNQLGLVNYRRQVAAVMQDDQLLSGSIRDNIVFFEEQYDMSWVEQCAQMAAVDKDIANMPMGYNSLIGDMGSALSGGQKQRILLARALYRKPKVLFLDEATSHLDTDTESIVSNAIKELKITRVVIAHRPETIASADRVINLKALV